MIMLSSSNHPFSKFFMMTLPERKTNDLKANSIIEVKVLSRQKYDRYIHDRDALAVKIKFTMASAFFRVQYCSHGLFRI